MVTIEYFISDRLRGLSSFAAQWVDKHQIDSAEFPLELETLEEWEEHFMSFKQQGTL